jgi:hypothetical protein
MVDGISNEGVEKRSLFWLVLLLWLRDQLRRCLHAKCKTVLGSYTFWLDEIQMSP